MNVQRGYFALGDWEAVVRVTADADFRVSIWARNVETSSGGIQVLTPPSQFRTPASSGPQDGLVMDVPAQTGIDLGSIGGKAKEAIELSAAGGRVAVFLTAEADTGTTIDMTWDPV